MHLDNCLQLVQVVVSANLIHVKNVGIYRQQMSNKSPPQGSRSLSGGCGWCAGCSNPTTVSITCVQTLLIIIVSVL